MTDFNNKRRDLQTREKELNSLNNEYSKKIEKGENTIHFEKDLENKLNEFKKILDKLEEEYRKKSDPDIKMLVDREYNNRVKEIHNFLMNYDRMKMKYNQIKKKNYSYKGDTSKYDNYQESESMQKMGTEELLKYQEEKVQNQDEQIGEIIGEVKKGKVLAKKIGEDLKDQNEQLEILDKNVQLYHLIFLG